MKKARRIKAGVLAFTAVVSVAVTSVPVYAVEDRFKGRAEKPGKLGV